MATRSSARSSSRTEARPSAHDRLLDAADDLFAAGGSAATPVDAVLARAGVAPATLYAHFGSKDRLLAATLDRRLARWEAVWDEAVAAAGTGRDRLLAVFEAMTGFRGEYPPARWCAFLGAAAEGPITDEAVADAVRRDAALLRRRLTDLALPLAGDRAEELAAHLEVVVTGCLAMRLRDPDHDPVPQARATAAMLVDAFGR